MRRIATASTALALLAGQAAAHGAHIPVPEGPAHGLAHLALGAALGAAAVGGAVLIARLRRDRE